VNLTPSVIAGVTRLMKVMFQEALMQADEHDAQADERIGDFWGLPSCFKGISLITDLPMDRRSFD